MPRRMVNIRATPEVVAQLFSASLPGVWWRTDRGLPPGAKLIGCGHDWDRQLFWFTFEHESFPEVPDGEFVPDFRGVELSAICLSPDLTAADTDMLKKQMVAQVAEYEDTDGAIRRAQNSVFAQGVRPVVRFDSPQDDSPKPHVV